MLLFRSYTTVVRGTQEFYLGSECPVIKYSYSVFVRKHPDLSPCFAAAHSYHAAH